MAGTRVTDGVRKRFLKYPENRSCMRAVHARGNARHDSDAESRLHGHASRLIFDSSRQVSMIQRRRPKVAGDSTDHRNSDVYLADGRLKPIDNVTRSLQLTKTPDGSRKVELDAGQELTEFVVELAGKTGPLLLAHLLDAIGQSAEIGRS